MNSPCNVSGVFGILSIIIHENSRFTIQDNQKSFLWNYVWILVQQFMNQHPEICQSYSCSSWCIVLTLCTWLSNWSWNMCAMVNYRTLIKYNVCSCTSSSVWKILPTRIRKNHQVIISFNTSLSQQISY